MSETNDEDLVTVLHYEVVPVLKEGVITRKEFDEFNRRFESHDEDERMYAYEELIAKLDDWDGDSPEYFVPEYSQQGKLYFKAYEGDRTDCTDDCLSLDGTKWFQPLKGKAIRIRRDPIGEFYSKMVSRYAQPQPEQ